MIAPLERRLDDLRAAGDLPADDILTSFLGFVEEQGLSLYPAQEEAILEIFADKNVILNTPTGSGKSLVAVAAHFYAMAQGLRSFYTCPIKALVSEKFFALCRDFGPKNVGMMTGDATVNRDAPIICCTAEVLSNMALSEGAKSPVDVVVMDEFHYYADRERGVAWQIPLLTLPHVSYLLMSATLGDTAFFEAALTELTGHETALVRSTLRPVPLHFQYRETALHETIADLVSFGRVPVYLVNFTQRAAAEEAQNLMSVDLATKDEKKRIAEALVGVKFSSPYGKEFQRFIRHGIGIHHAGLLPKYRMLVERLAQQGLLKVISGTDTLGVGVNIPIRTVLFTKLCKYDGASTAVLSVRDFQQISGRAGRKGFDVEGFVVAQAPEHVIENLKLENKANGDAKKLRRMVRKKPPEKGYVPFDRKTFDRLVSSPPEPLVSRFSVSHGMLLEVLSREEGGCRALKDLIRGCHDRPAEKRRHGKTAMMLFRSLVDANILQLVPRTEDPRGLRNMDLQLDFSLHQALSLYLLETLPLLDRETETYALDVLTLVESILEDPDLILRRQLDRIKDIRMAEMKAAGVEYEERMAELAKLDYPKPHSEFIYDTFNAFRRRHPWLGQENIRPKSIARDMVELFQSFSEYVKEYDLERAEGLLLRYLSETYKALVQTVPEQFRNDEMLEIITYLGSVVRGVDGSLLEAWEKMQRPDAPTVEGEPEEVEPPNVTTDRKTFTVLVRNDVFRLVRALARREWEEAATLAEGSLEEWPKARLEGAMKAYFDEHRDLDTSPRARQPKHTIVTETEDGAAWDITQTLCDAEDATGFALKVRVDLQRAREAGKPILELVGIADF